MFYRSRSRFIGSNPIHPIPVRRLLLALCGAASAVSILESTAQQTEAFTGPVFEQGMPSGVLTPRPGFNWGRFEFHGGIGGGVAYDDLVEIDSKGNKVDDFTWTLAPFGSVETRGPNNRSVRAYYRPSFEFFTSHSDLNSMNHAGTFDLKWPFNRLTLSLAENVNVASVVVRDIANRATRQIFSTIGSADYELSDRTSLQANLTYDLYGYQGEVTGAKNLVDSQAFGQQLWADYHWTTKVSTGMGVSISEVDVQNGPSQMAEGPEWRVNYNPKPELTLQGSVGVQFRQYDSDRSNTVEPILKLHSSYEVRQGTILSLEAHRAERASALSAGQNYVDTGFVGSVSQAFLRKFRGTASAGYTFADYRATDAGVEVNRSDSYYYVRTSVNWSITQGWGSELFFEHTANDSNSSSFNYDHNIVGLRASWSF